MAKTENLPILQVSIRLTIIFVSRMTTNPVNLQSVLLIVDSAFDKYRDKN